MLIERTKPLKEISNYKIGGNANLFCSVENLDELREAVALSKTEDLPTFILASGTNVLISDEYLDYLIIKPDFKKIEIKNNLITVGAGVGVGGLLNYLIENSLSDLEWAGGLPGTFGGAVRGNAGAFKGEIKDNLVSVTSFNIRTGDTKTFNKEECNFSYRDSIFKKAKGEEIIMEAVLELQKGDQQKIKELIAEKINFRNDKHSMEYPSLGSMFKNIPLSSISEENRPRYSNIVKSDPVPVVPVAYFIAEAGLKGTTIGGAQISPKHANFIVNLGGARANDVCSLINLAEQQLKAQFGVVAEPEIEFLGINRDLN